MVYEYKCKLCGKVTEFIRTVAQREFPAPCKHCPEGEGELMISSTSFSLTGDCWARDGYK